MKRPLLQLSFLAVCLVGNFSVTATTAIAATEPTLANISTRASVQTGDNVVIAGLIIQGAQPKRVIIRALGPELSQYGVPNFLANPTLELYDGAGTLIASNNNWVTTIIGGIITSNQVADIRASGYAPTDPFESAIVAELPAGNYTAIVRGVNNTTGVGLVEVYDLSPGASSLLANISTRGFVQTGDNVMIGGFNVTGTRPKGIYLRAIGPDLTKYGISDVLADPTIELYDNTGALIASNDSWRQTAISGIIVGDQVRHILSTGLAPGDRNDAALIATLEPGNYTAIVRGVNNTTGVALLEGTIARPIFTWTGATNIHWETPTNWTPNGVPGSGDNAIIPAGSANSPIISIPHVKDVQITLGTPEGGSVSLDADSVEFSNVNLTVAGGDPGSSPVNAMLSCHGSVSIDGNITVEALGGSLTIDAGEGTFTLKDSDAKADMASSDNPGNVEDSRKPAKPEVKLLVTQESSLFFKGENIVTERVATDKNVLIPVVEIEGAADIAENVTLKGDGIVSLDSGGRLFIEGAVDSGQQVDFFDGTGKISFGNPASFLGTVGFTPVTGGRMDFPGIQAQSLGLGAPTLGVRLLTLYSGPNQTGNTLAQVKVQTVSSEGLLPTRPPNVPPLTGNDFALTSNGKGGTLITYVPKGTTYLEQSMPVPVVASRSTKVPLETIFAQSFGTSKPAFYSITLLLPTKETNTNTDHKYWGSLPVAPVWFVNGTEVKRESRKIKDSDRVELLVGNNIPAPAQFNAQVTRATSGPESEVVSYSVWTVDPRVAKAVESTPGKPTPADMIASANGFNSTFPDVPNTNLCNSIADDVAVGAGATMPLPDAQLDPTDNVEGGFWRIVYTGNGPNPVENWFNLVLPGDVIRMQHAGGGGHSTTALSGRNSDGTLTVYDNGDGGFIGIHNATYDKHTNPAGTTIYRLDPNQQYLILGTSIGEVMQGSVYDNLFRPGGGADVVIAGPSNNEIQDITSHLDGITVKNFHAGDLLNFTDRHPNGVTAQYDATTGRLTISHSGHQIAAITMPGLNADAQFSVTSNPGGGSNITLLP